MASARMWKVAEAMATYALGGITLAAMVAWLGRAHRFPMGDAPHLVGTELRLALMLTEGQVKQAWLAFNALLAPHPPAGYVPGILSFLIAGPRPGAALLAMSLVSLFICDALRRFNAGRVPLAAWLVLLASPMFWTHFEGHARDLVAAAIVLESLSWLHVSDWLERRWESMMFGLFMGAGFVTKYTFPLYLVLPCVFVLVRLRSRQQWLNLMVSVTAFALIAGPWLIPNMSRVLDYARSSSGSSAELITANARSLEQRRSLAGLLSYPLALKDAVGWPGLFVLLFGGVVGIRERRFPYLALASALSGLILLSAMPQFQERYALPAFCCMTLLALPLGRRPMYLVPLLLVFGIQLGATVMTFRPGAPVTLPRFDHPLETAFQLAWPRSPVYLPNSFRVKEWSTDEQIRALAEAHGRRDGTVGILVTGRSGEPDFGTFLLRSLYLGYRWDIATLRPRLEGKRLNIDVFVGPLMVGDWPPRTFQALAVVYRDEEDPAILAFLENVPMERTWERPLQDRTRGLVLKREGQDGRLSF